MTTPLPPSTMGSGALYSYTTASTTANNNNRLLPLPSLRASPIAHFSSIPNDGIGNDKLKPTINSSGVGLPTAGRLLAVNSTYVAYAVKKGLVRVIHRQTNAKILLRGHDEHVNVVDASFFGEGSVAGSVGVECIRKELAVLHRIKKHLPGNKAAAVAAGGAQPPSIGISPEDPLMHQHILATVGGMGDSAGVITWVITVKPDGSLHAHQLGTFNMECHARIIWNPFCPQFAVLYRNFLDDGESSIIHDTNTGLRARAVANIYDPTRGPIAGMSALSVGFGRDGSDNSALLGANDIAWSTLDGKFVLTGHDDGGVRLWNVGAATIQSQQSGKPCIVDCHATLNVASASRRENDEVGDENARSARAVTRVLFLGRYEDSLSNATSITTRAVTPPFITGTDMNHTITLWSSFTWDNNQSVIGSPTRLRVFGLRNHVNDNSFPLSDMISLELCPAPYRPPLSLKDSSIKNTDEEATCPSSFLLMAERNTGLLHALHLETEWKASSDGSDVAAAVAVKGFDYVTTLNVVYPIYSFCVAPTVSASSSDGSHGPTASDGGRKNALKEDHDVDLCCIQSKAVQKLTLAAEMCAAPENSGTEMDLAPGVTLLNFDAEEEDGEVEAEEEEVEEEEEEFEEGDFEDDYDLGEEDLANAEFSTNHSDDEEDVDESGAVPTEEVLSDAAASSWLGAIVNPRPSTTPARASSAPPGLALPPGLGLPSGPSPMSLLSPMQILSESSSGLDVSNEKPVKSSAPSMPVAEAVSSSSSIKPVTILKKQKKQDAIKKADTKQPVAPMKILQRGEAPAQPISTAALPAADVTDTSGLKVDITEIEAAMQRSIAAQLKSHETDLLSSLKKFIASEVKSAISSSFKDAERATELAVQRGIASGLSNGLKKSLDGELGNRLEKHAKDNVAMVAKDALESMQPLIMSSLHQVCTSQIMRIVMFHWFYLCLIYMLFSTPRLDNEGCHDPSVRGSDAPNVPANLHIVGEGTCGYVSRSNKHRGIDNTGLV